MHWKNGTLEFFEHVKAWQIHARHPYQGKADVQIGQSHLLRSGPIGVAIVEGQLTQSMLDIPLACIDTNRMDEILHAATQWHLAMAYDEDAKRAQSDKFFDSLGEPNTEEWIERVNEHKGVWLTTPGGNQAYIDAEITQTIQRLWNEGVDVQYSCQGNPSGGLYLCANGMMPKQLRMAAEAAGIDYEQESFRWTLWDTAPRLVRAQFHNAVRLLFDDIAERGLNGIDTSGQRYRPKTTEPLKFEPWIELVTAQTQAALALAASQQGISREDAV